MALYTIMGIMYSQFGIYYSARFTSNPVNAKSSFNEILSEQTKMINL